MRRARPVRSGGFTLVEILVVIGVLAVLMGLILPVLARARAEGRRTACKSNLGQIAKAAQMYAGEHNSIYPKMATKPSVTPTEPRLCDVFATYAPDPRVFRCPADHLALYEMEGSSYEWNFVLNGRTQDSVVEELMGPSKTPMLYDYENFHPVTDGGYGGKNVAFCDGSVGN